MTFMRSIPRIVIAQVVIGMASMVLAVLAIDATQKTLTEKRILETKLQEGTRLLALRQRELDEATRKSQELDARLAKVRSVVYAPVIPEPVPDSALKATRPREFELLSGIRLVDSVLHAGAAPPEIEELRYNSEGFAAYMLHKYSSEQVDVIDAHALKNRLNSTTSSPVTGDIAFFDDGTALFYVQGKAPRESYYVGMTPYGIDFIRPRFVKIDRYAHIQY